MLPAAAPDADQPDFHTGGALCTGTPCRRSHRVTRLPRHAWVTPASTGPMRGSAQSHGSSNEARHQVTHMTDLAKTRISFSNRNEAIGPVPPGTVRGPRGKIFRPDGSL